MSPTNSDKRNFLFTFALSVRVRACACAYTCLCVCVYTDSEQIMQHKDIAYACMCVCMYIDVEQIKQYMDTGQMRSHHVQMCKCAQHQAPLGRCARHTPMHAPAATSRCCYGRRRRRRASFHLRVRSGRTFRAHSGFPFSRRTQVSPD
jgi:hypothetical protein